MPSVAEASFIHSVMLNAVETSLCSFFKDPSTSPSASLSMTNAGMTKWIVNDKCRIDNTGKGE